MRKAILVIMLISLFLTSCKPTVDVFTPGESQLPEATEGDNNYYIRFIDENILPEPIRLNRSAAHIRIGESENDVQISSMFSQTNAYGALAFEDDQAEAIIPIVILDENGAPIESVQVTYVSSISSNGTITVSVTDPQERYLPQFVVIPYEMLRSPKISYRKEDSHFSLFKPSVAYAAPQKGFTILAGILIILKTWGAIETGKDVMTVLGLRGNHIVASAVGIDYVCRSPVEIEKAKAGLFTTLILTPIRPAKNLDPVRKVALAVGKEIAPTITKQLVEGDENEVILFRIFHYTPEQMDAIYGTLYAYQPKEYGELVILEPLTEYEYVEGEYVEVGRCVEAPNFKYQPITEARTWLQSEGLNWAEICTNEVGPPRTVNPLVDQLCPAGPIMAQNPEAGEYLIVLNEDFIPVGPIVHMPTLQLTVGLDLSSPPEEDLPQDPMELGFSDLEQFKILLKQSFEAANYAFMDNLIRSDPSEEFVFWAGAYNYEGMSMSHEEALETISNWDLSSSQVTITEDVEELLAMLDHSPTFAGPVVLVAWTDGSNPMLLEISWHEGRYYWTGFLTVPCSRDDPEIKDFCNSVGYSESGTGDVTANGYDLTDFNEFMSALEYAVEYQDFEVLADLISEPFYQLVPHIGPMEKYYETITKDEALTWFMDESLKIFEDYLENDWIASYSLDSSQPCQSPDDTQISFVFYCVKSLDDEGRIVSPFLSLGISESGGRFYLSEALLSIQ